MSLLTKMKGIYNLSTKYIYHNFFTYQICKTSHLNSTSQRIVFCMQRRIDFKFSIKIRHNYVLKSIVTSFRRPVFLVHLVHIISLFFFKNCSSFNVIWSYFHSLKEKSYAKNFKRIFLSKILFIKTWRS